MINSVPLGFFITYFEVVSFNSGCIRDVLLSNPCHTEKGIYASAAMVEAMIVVLGDYLNYSKETVSAIAIDGLFRLTLLGFRDKKTEK